MIEHNGCGTCKGFWKWFKPPYKNFFENECNLHDRQYNLGGNRLDRKISDLMLLNNMRKKVLNHFHKRKLLSKIWFLIICQAYYIGVRVLGFSNFNYLKNED